MSRAITTLALVAVLWVGAGASEEFDFAAAPAEPQLQPPVARGVFGDALAIVRVGMRGTIHALRDVLSPDMRPEVPNRKLADTDAPMPGETDGDFAARWRVRNTLVGLADALGAAKYMESHPEGTRYVVAGLLGALMFGTLALTQVAAGCCARFTMGAIMRVAFGERTALPEEGASPGWNVLEMHNARIDAVREELAARDGRLRQERAESDSKKSR